MDYRELQDQIVAFRNARGWEKAHTPKDSAISLSLEAAELLEHFQWKTDDQFKKYLKTNKEGVADELIDILYWVLLMSYDLDIDIAKEFKRKMQKNALKYPLN